MPFVEPRLPIDVGITSLFHTIMMSDETLLATSIDAMKALRFDECLEALRADPDNRSAYEAFEKKDVSSFALIHDLLMTFHFGRHTKAEFMQIMEKLDERLIFYYSEKDWNDIKETRKQIRSLHKRAKNPSKRSREGVRPGTSTVSGPSRASARRSSPTSPEDRRSRADAETEKIEPSEGAERRDRQRVGSDRASRGHDDVSHRGELTSPHPRICSHRIARSGRQGRSVWPMSDRRNGLLPSDHSHPLGVPGM